MLHLTIQHSSLCSQDSLTTGAQRRKSLPLLGSLSHLSIRRRLQASCLPSVLAGYGMLLLANRQLATENWIANHNDGVDQLQGQLTMEPDPPDGAGLQRRINRVDIPGSWVWLKLKNGRPYQESSGDSIPLPAGTMVRLLSTAGAFA